MSVKAGQAHTDLNRPGVSGGVRQSGATPGLVARLTVLLASTHSLTPCHVPAGDLLAPRQACRGKAEHDTFRVCTGRLLKDAGGTCPSKCPSTGLQVVG
jgi:hypothetical protein